MPKNILLKTILLVSLIIITGFFVVGIISYYFASRVYMRDTENISSLTSEVIYYRLESIFAKPINISLTMANDRFLINFLAKEDANIYNDEYILMIQEYLDAYKKQYDYDSVFLVSVKSRRYYNFNGLDRILTQDNPENVWFFDFLENPQEYAMNVDHDQANQNEITVFVNCSLKNDNGELLGIVGVGLRIGYMQSLLQEYSEAFGVDILLVNENGNIMICADETGNEITNHFEVCAYPELKTEILNEKEKALAFWFKADDRRFYVVTQYIPQLSWHLIVEKDMKEFETDLLRRFLEITLVVIISIVAVLFVIIYVIRRYTARITELTVSLETERQKAFPHFLYNVLVVIRQLCKNNPVLAEETVVEFSDYLRGNLDFISINKPIPFDRELKHTQTYLALEKKRFGDRLTINFDIKCRDFSLPALTLQPIAENAVRYGAAKRENGGKVTIKTQESNRGFVITVTDNGEGFDVNQNNDDSRSHIGLENVKNRLAAMCGGTLKIESVIGYSTTVTIEIPKGEKT